MTRKLCLAGLCGLVGVVLLSMQAPSGAEGKKDDAAKATIAKLQQQLKDKEEQIKSLQAQLKTKKGEKGYAQLKKDLDAANQSIKDKDDQIKTLQGKTAVADLTKENSTLRSMLREADKAKKAPFVHTLILKLKKDDDAKTIKSVADEAGKTLAKIDGVRGFWLGKRAESGTPELAQTSYQLGIVVLLDDADALAKFLDDPLHKKFNDKFKDAWERPIVYDIQRRSRK